LQELGQLSDISFPLQLFYLTTSLQQLQKGKRLEFNYKATQWGKNKRKKKEDYPQPFFSLYCRLAASNQDQQRDVGNPSH
jgi:hypothetical protein